MLPQAAINVAILVMVDLSHAPIRTSASEATSASFLVEEAAAYGIDHGRTDGERMDSRYVVLP